MTPYWTFSPSDHTREDFVKVVELFKAHGLVLQPTFVAFQSVDDADGLSGFAGDHRAT